MHDPLRDEPKRFLRMFLFWDLIPWWRVPPAERPLMWRVFWWRLLPSLLLILGLILTTVLMGPMTAVHQFIARLAGPQAEQNPGSYLFLAAVLTVVGPIAVVLLTWYFVRRHIRRRRRLGI